MKHYDKTSDDFPHFSHARETNKNKLREGRETIFIHTFHPFHTIHILRFDSKSIETIFLCNFFLVNRKQVTTSTNNKKH